MSDAPKVDDGKGTLLRSADAIPEQGKKEILQLAIADMRERFLSDNSVSNSLTSSEENVVRSLVDFLMSVCELPEGCLPFISGNISRMDCAKGISVLVMPENETPISGLLVPYLLGVATGNIIHTGINNRNEAIAAGRSYTGEFVVPVANMPISMTRQCGRKELEDLRSSGNMERAALAFVVSDLYTEFAAQQKEHSPIIVPGASTQTN